MALVLQNVVPGTPPKLIYTDTETGNSVVKNEPEEDAVGNPPAKQEGTSQQGNTTVEEEPVGFTSDYGKKPIQAREYDVSDTSGGNSDSRTLGGGEHVRSLFNNWSLMSYKGTHDLSPDSSGDTVYNKYNKAINTAPSAKEPTAKNIVQYSKSSESLGFKYSLSDFIQCEHYGQISNSYMVTLRRFPYPVPDDIFNPKQVGPKGEVVDIGKPDLARAITWMSPALGNDLKEILSFNHKLNWKEVESKVQEVNQSKDQRGTLGGMIDGDPVLSAIESGLNGYSAEEAIIRRDKGEGFDPLKETYPNTVYGPLNVIKNIMTREQGLTFEQEFKLTFHYDLRAYGNTSPKVAFMDTLSNILALTYNNAPFWGGATRYTSSGTVGKPFGDYDKLKAGDYGGFLGGLASQFSDTVSNIKSEIESGNFGDSKILDNVIGGGLMKLMNGPQGGQVVNALLTGDPTGQWHLTIGNPMNPMMMIGNLACTDSNVSFEGPLGFEDFPSKMKIEVTLKPARMRDKGEIESMFNAGKGRMYLQPKVDGQEVPEVVNVSAYGNKDLANNPDRVTKISDMSAG